MAYSYDQIIQAYTVLHVGKAPDAATASSLQLTANLNTQGQLTDAQVLSILLNGADSTTAVAVLSYQFFTGKSPTAAGLTYLVNSATNAADLNDAYYSKFTLENRYINFAANLGVQGEGATAFAAKYGALSFSDYVASIYQTIVGSAYATAAGIDPAAAIASIISRKDAILATAQSAGMIPANATAAQIDIALKAATAGYLLGEAIKADVGLYAAAADNFMLALAAGTAVYNTDITVTYKPTPDTGAHGTTGLAVDHGVTLPTLTTTTTPSKPNVVQTILSAGADTIVGTAADETFTASNTTLSAGDSLNGGPGADILNVSVAGLFDLPAVTVTDVETVNFAISGNFRGSNWTNWTGVTNLNLAFSNGTASIQNLPSTADIAITGTFANASPYISGGHNITLTATAVAGNGTIEVDNNSGNTNVTLTNTGAGAHPTLSVNYLGGNAVLTRIADLTGIANGSTQYNGVVSFHGSATSTSVEIVNPTPVAATGSSVGIGGGGVFVADYQSYISTTQLGSLATVKIDGFTSNSTYDVYIVDNALRNLTLAHGSGTVYISNFTFASSGFPTTLNLNVSALSNVFLHEDGYYTTMNVTTGSAASTMSAIESPTLTTLNVNGSGLLLFTQSVNNYAPLLHTVTATGGAILNITFGAGNDTITVGAGDHLINTGAGTDLVTVTAGNASIFTYPTLFVSPGDKLAITPQGGAAAFTGTMGAIATGANYQALLNSAASGDGHTTSHWGWFQFAGDTYIVLDNSAASTFQPGTDIVVKLVGAFNEGGASITAGVLTIQ